MAEEVAAMDVEEEAGAGVVQPWPSQLATRLMVLTSLTPTEPSLTQNSRSLELEDVSMSTNTKWEVTNKVWNRWELRGEEKNPLRKSRKALRLGARQAVERTTVRARPRMADTRPQQLKVGGGKNLMQTR